MKKQETLEEVEIAALKYNEQFIGGQESRYAAEDFINGAKWQQEQDSNKYSDDEVKKIAFDFYYDMSHKMNVPENLISENMTNVDVWFETFKNKK